jgi:hypothetical protein
MPQSRAKAARRSTRRRAMPWPRNKVRLRIGELRFLRVLHEVVLVEPRTIQLREASCVLWSERSDLDVHV